ncbi:hypothetical protein C5167_050713 [Papaver somniferum]|uniref:Uncharacterized protein n=1 Tax=Papaver somniferum TaxID=3469 RepID=A0A4Y7KSY6_PAPSO|nr:hypothetical protein C5167_050713 [Papaver somniferum]
MVRVTRLIARVGWNFLWCHLLIKKTLFSQRKVPWECGNSEVTADRIAAVWKDFAGVTFLSIRVNNGALQHVHDLYLELGKKYRQNYYHMAIQ